MGTTAFQWENKTLLLAQNRNNFDSQVIQKASWNVAEKIGQTIVGSWFDEKQRGTWLGCSKSNRVAFMVEPMRTHGGNDELFQFIIRFLKGTMDIAQFSVMVSDKCKKRANTNLVVLDIASDEMYHLKKKDSSDGISFIKVSHGVHTLSEAGLDSESAMDQRLRGKLDHKVAGNNEPPELNVIIEELMKDTVPAVDGNDRSSVFVDDESLLMSESYTEVLRYRTTSTSALEVKKSNKEVNFVENFLMGNGEWGKQEFGFQMLR